MATAAWADRGAGAFGLVYNLHSFWYYGNGTQFGFAICFDVSHLVRIVPECIIATTESTTLAQLIKAKDALYIL